MKSFYLFLFGLIVFSCNKESKPSSHYNNGEQRVEISGHFYNQIDYSGYSNCGYLFVPSTETSENFHLGLLKPINIPDSVLDLISLPVNSEKPYKIDFVFKHSLFSCSPGDELIGENGNYSKTYYELIEILRINEL
jgi:hypothetical protein